jgi:hypothetical protein
LLIDESGGLSRYVLQQREELQQVEINIRPPIDHLGAAMSWEAANEHLLAAEKLKLLLISLKIINA